MKPKVIILKTDGINCDEELVHAFTVAGGNVDLVHVNELRDRTKKLDDYKILGIPGGFSYGDDIVSGKILATELTSFFSRELTKFIKRPDTQVIGICNGFQVLVRTGLLPFGKVGEMDVTLTDNDSGHFECRWVDLVIDPQTKSKALQKMRGKRVSYQVAHGEGKFFTSQEVLASIEKENLVALRYVDQKGVPTQDYPANPNGALHAIAGITDRTGRIIGMMPHPERFVVPEHYPNWRREKRSPEGLSIFENMIDVARGEEKKYKKYALIGTSCVGKSTLIKKLPKMIKRKLADKAIVTVPEAARIYFSLVKTSSPFEYKHQRNIQKLIWELEEHAMGVDPDIVLTDRSVLDAAAFLHAQKDFKGSKELMDRVLHLLKDYDHLFLLDPRGVAYQTDDIRKESFKQREEIHLGFLAVLSEISIPWTLVTGSKQERLQTMLEVIYTSHR